MPRQPIPATNALTVRQRIAYEALLGAPNRTPAELGALLHQHVGKHNSDERCGRCSVDGSLVAKELERLGLATRERKRAFRATDHT
jgi:hypothetical protein